MGRARPHRPRAEVMKLVKSEFSKDGEGFATVIAEDSEDLWHAYNLIVFGDKVKASTFRCARWPHPPLSRSSHWNAASIGQYDSACNHARCDAILAEHFHACLFPPATAFFYSLSAVPLRRPPLPFMDSSTDSIPTSAKCNPSLRRDRERAKR